MPKETNKQTKLSGTTKKKTTKSSTTKATKPKVPLKINTSKLKVGMTVKNYKELCELLKQEVTTGNAKKYQLKEFECYVHLSSLRYMFRYASTSSFVLIDFILLLSLFIIIIYSDK